MRCVQNPDAQLCSRMLCRTPMLVTPLSRRRSGISSVARKLPQRLRRSLCCSVFGIGVQQSSVDRQFVVRGAHRASRACWSRTGEALIVCPISVNEAARMRTLPELLLGVLAEHGQPCRPCLSLSDQAAVERGFQKCCSPTSCLLNLRFVAL